MATTIFFRKVGHCYKIGGYVDLGLFKTKGSKCNSIKIC